MSNVECRMSSGAGRPSSVGRRLSRLLCRAVLVAATSAWAAKEAPTRLDVSAQPEGVQVFVDGTLRGTAPCSVFDLQPGRHLVHVTAPSCRPEDEFVVLEAGAFVQKTYSLAQEKGLLLVKTDPSGADVKCNGVSLGTTPLLVTSLPSGRTHLLDLSLNGYRPRRIDATLEGRVPMVREESLVLDSGVVECTTEPAGATVTVNGVERGITPVTISNIPKGLATITVSLAGYRTETRELRLQPGDRQTLAVKLAGKPARLAVVTTPEQARVFVDGDYQGKSPATISSLAAGTHEVRVELAGHASVTRKVELANGAEATEEFKLVSVMGRMEIVTTPPGAKISLDGKAVGTTKAQGDASRSQILAIENVAGGDHSVLAHLDGCLDVSRSVTVKANDTAKLFLRLSRVFAPDTEVETSRGIYRGVLVNKDFLGNLTPETAPGVEQTFKAEEIRKVKPLAK